MAYFNSPCEQCYYFDICNANRKEVRSSKIRNDSVRWGEIDCFKSIESHKRDFNTLPDWKKKKVLECMELQCFGTYKSENSCHKCHVVNECEIIKRVKSSNWR